MISSAAWIAKGRAAQHPTSYKVDDNELERVAKLANVHFEDAKVQFERAQKVAAGWHDGKDMGDDEGWEDDEQEEEEVEGEEDEKMDAESEEQNATTDPATKEDPNDLSKYNLDNYDDDENEATTMGPFSNIKGLQYYRNNDEDPYITLKEDPVEAQEEREELEVMPTDNMIITAKTEDEVSLLEAYVYIHEDANLYVHHDLMLPSFPLCLEWLDYKPSGGGEGSADQNSNVGAKGNFIAVGTMDPEIEIWSMDVVEGLFPDAILGQKDITEQLNAPKGTGKKKRKQAKERVPNANYHVDAVLGLSWNKLARNLLASASADSTVKLWDLSKPADENGGTNALRSFGDLHTDKVQSVAWDTSNSSRGSIGQPARLLSGSYDKTICIFDSRSPSDVVRASVSADLESVRWNPWREHNFFVSMEDGLVQSFDARMLTKEKSASAIFTLSAHDGACTSLDISPHIPGCIVTGGTDKLVKLWNVEGDSSFEVNAANQDINWRPSSLSMVASRNLDAGKIFSVQFSPDDPLTLVAAGSRGVLRVWDALANVGARKTFGDRLRAMPADLSKTAVRIDGNEPARGDGVVRLADESDNESDDGGDVAMEE